MKRTTSANRGGRDPPAPHIGLSTRESVTDVAEAKDDPTELPPDLAEFINQLIVPLLVAQYLNETGHLYRADPSYYDDEGQAQAA